MPAATQTKRKRGRPKLSGTKYSADLAKIICDRIAKGDSLQTIAKSPNMPAVQTISLWVVDDYQGFAGQYARAKRACAELLANEIFAIADDTSNDLAGELQIPNNVAVNRARLMVDTRKWYLSKVLPKIYGDRIALTDSDGGPVQFVTRSILEDAPSVPRLTNGKTIEGK